MIPCKKIAILLIVFVLFLFLGCAPKKVLETPPTTVPPPEETPAEVDEIETGISDISDIDEDLDTSDLDEIDTMLEDIENI